MFAKKLRIYWKIIRDHLEIINLYKWLLFLYEFIIFQLKIDIFMPKTSGVIKVRLVLTRGRPAHMTSILVFMI